MKILFLSDIFDSRFDYDQVLLAKLLASRGHYIDVLCSNSLLDGNKVARGFAFDPSNVNVIRNAGPIFRFPRSYPLYTFRITDLQDNYDVIHAFTFFSYSSLIAPFLKRKLRSNLIMRAEIGESGSRTFHRIKISPFHRIALKWIQDNTQMITTFTKAEQSALISLKVPNYKIAVIPPGVEFEKFSNIAVDPGETLRLGYLGRFSPEKGVHRLVPLAKLLQKDRKWELYLSGLLQDPHYSESVLSALASYNNVRYIGTVDRNNNTSFFANIHVLLFPSVRETGGITVLEAMSAGRVVIASNIYPVDEFITNGKTGFLVNPENFADQAFHILQSLVSDPDMIVKIGTSARLSVSPYNWSNIISLYENLYNEACRS